MQILVTLLVRASKVYHVSKSAYSLGIQVLFDHVFMKLVKRTLLMKCMIFYFCVLATILSGLSMGVWFSKLGSKAHAYFIDGSLQVK